YRPATGFRLGKSSYAICFISDEDSHEEELFLPRVESIELRNLEFRAKRRGFRPHYVQLDSVLFRRFGKLELNPSAIEEFTLHYGPPQSEVRPFIVQIETGQLLEMLPSMEGRKGRSQSWLEDILSMRQCLRLWDLIQQEETEQLGRHIYWH